MVDADALKRLVVPAANLATPIVFEASETTKLDKVLDRALRVRVR